MPRIPGLRRVFRLATGRAPVADDVDAEVAFHLEMTAAELEARGVPLREDVRRPLRQLSDGERDELRGWHESS